MRGVARHIVERTAIQRQRRANHDLGTIGVVIASLGRVAEGERVAAAARQIGGLATGRANNQGDGRRPSDDDRLAPHGANIKVLPRAVDAAGRRRRHQGDRRRRGVHQHAAGINRWQTHRAAGVAERVSQRDSAGDKPSHGDAVAVVVARDHGVAEVVLRGAIAAHIGSGVRHIPQRERQTRRAKDLEVVDARCRIGRKGRGRHLNAQAHVTRRCHAEVGVRSRAGSVIRDHRKLLPGRTIGTSIKREVTGIHGVSVGGATIARVINHDLGNHRGLAQLNLHGRRQD